MKMNIIHSFYILAIGLLLYINNVYSKTQTVYEINVIPIDKNIFEAGVNNQIRISLWSKTRNYPVSLEEIEPFDDSTLIDVVVFSKDLRAFSQFHMQDFPHYNNETNLPTTANYFDIDYIFPVAGDYTISIKCKPYKKNVRVNKVIHVEGKKDAKMNVDNSILPSDPNEAKTIYYKPIPLENVKSVYTLPIIPHTQIIKEKNLKKELSKATGPIYGTKITIKNTLKSGYCSNFILEFFRVELKKDKVENIPLEDLFQYNNIPIKGIVANQEKLDFDIIQGNILNSVSDEFPSCGSKIDPPTEMVFGPNFGFSVPFREKGTYQVVFEIAHSYNENTYLLTPNIVIRVADEKETIKYAPKDYIDDDSNYDQFIKDVINKQSSAPADDDAPATEEKEDDNKDGEGDKIADAKEEENKEESKEGEEETKEEGESKEGDAKEEETKEGESKEEETKEEENKEGEAKEEESKEGETKEESKEGENKESDEKEETKEESKEGESKEDDAKEGESKEENKEEHKDEDAKEETKEGETKEETKPVDPDDEPLPESTHGKIIIIGVAGIITVSGFMFYNQKSSYRNVENIPSEYKQVNTGNDDDDDDEDFMLNADEKEMLDKRTNISLDIDEDMDQEDYTLMENDD